MTHKEAIDDLTRAARHHGQLFRFDYGFHLVVGGAAGMNFSLPSTDIIVVWAMMKTL